MKHNISNFKKSGVAWPLSLTKTYENNFLEKKYFDFQKKAIDIFGKKISIKPNLLSTFFDELAFSEEILDNVKSLIGNNLYLWSSAFFCKAPGEGKIVSYHQDNPYWQLTTTKVVSVWIALTNSDKKSGCLELVPNSHHLGVINKLDVDNPRQAYLNGEKTTDQNDLLSYKQDLNEFLINHKPEVVELKPGNYSIHHVNTVHGSGVNLSDNYRVGFALRYISSDTMHKEEKKDSAVHVCGEKNPYFDEEKRPKADFDDEAIKTYEQAMLAAGAFGNKKY